MTPLRILPATLPRFPVPTPAPRVAPTLPSAGLLALQRALAHDLRWGHTANVAHAVGIYPA